MIGRDTVGLALRNLRQARLRTALTTMGVAIGIASLAGMVSFGVGLEDQLVGRFMKSGLFDSITVMSAQDIPGGFARLGGAGRRGRGAGAGAGRGAPEAPPAAPPAPLDDAALATLRALPDVREVYPVLRVPAQIRAEDGEAGALLAGVPMSAKSEGAFQTFAAGGFFSREDGDECLVTADFLKRLTEKTPQTMVGQPLTLRYAGRATGEPTTIGTAATVDAPAGAEGNIMGIAPSVGVQPLDASCRIAGVVERDPGGVGGGGLSGVMLPLPRALAIDANSVRGAASLTQGANAARTYNSGIIVKTRRAEATQDVEAKIKALGFNAFSINDALQGAKRGFLILDIVLSLIGSIALAVSSLGIVNTMVMSILERTREIGIMKAIGGSDADIRKIFLVEASAIGVFGGAAGVALGWLVGRVINFGANIYIQQQGGTPGDLFSLPLWLIGGAIGFSWVISLLAGSYPASRAAKLDPIKALRHD